MFYILLSGACGYAVLQAQLVHSDYCLEGAAAHRGVVLAVGLELKTISNVTQVACRLLFRAVGRLLQRGGRFKCQFLKGFFLH